MPIRRPGVPGDAGTTGDAADERIPMLFGCCHPALRVEARLALMLRAVVGLTTPQIARAFLVPEATMAQRLVRAKRKIGAVGIAFEIPEGRERASRLDEVLTAIYLTYNAGYLSRADSGLADDAIWLAELLARALPEEAEAWGLLALLTSLSARARTRFDADGRLVLLADQDRDRLERGGSGSGGGVPDAVGRAAASGTVPAAGGDRRLSRRRGTVGGHRLAADPDPLRPAAHPRPVTRGPAQPRDRAQPRVRTRAGVGRAERDRRPTRRLPPAARHPGPAARRSG